jgi:hypothetical protein
MSDAIDYSKLQSSKPIDVSKIFERFAKGYYDPNPPYQRGIVWKKKLKVKLIRSIMCGMPINNVHLVKKGENKNTPHSYILDGKQRITTIVSFIRNEFSVKVPPSLLQGTGINRKNYRIFWKDIQNEAHPLHYLEQRIMDFTINATEWDPMGFAEQLVLFNTINTSASLCSEEKIYCNYYPTRFLLEYLFNNSFKKIHRFMPANCRDKNNGGTNRRFKGIRLLHHLLILSYGKKLDDHFAFRSVNQVIVEGSCKQIEKLLVEKGVDATTIFSVDLLRRLGLHKVHEELKTIGNLFEQIVNYKNFLSMEFDKNALVFILSFLLKKYREKALTSSLVEHNLEEFHQMITKYLEIREADRKEFKQSTQNIEVIKINFDFLEMSWDEMNIDKGPKNAAPTKSQVLRAKLASPLSCKKTGAVIHDGNAQIDHIKPKSLHSKTDYQVLSASGNRIKSNTGNSSALK